MSFILDALRKSEHDRNRDKGPGLVEVAVALPPSKKNLWAAIAVALLVVNLIAIGVVLLKRSGNSDEQASAAGDQNVAAATSVERTMPAPALAPAPIAGPSYDPGSDGYQSRVIPGTVPPVLQPALPADGVNAARNPLADELGAGDAGYEPGYEPGYDDGTGYPTAPPGMSGPLPQKRGSVVYEHVPEADPITSRSHPPAETKYPYADDGGGVPPSPGAASNPGTTVSSAPSSTLPTVDELGAQAGVPELHLDIHVWSTKPAERFAFINSAKYKEGDTLKEGPHIDRITPDGVELSYRGNRFALPRQ